MNCATIFGVQRIATLPSSSGRLRLTGTRARASSTGRFALAY